MGKLPYMFATIFVCFGHDDSYKPLINAVESAVMVTP